VLHQVLNIWSLVVVVVGEVLTLVAAVALEDTGHQYQVNSLVVEQLPKAHF
jgi:hypothetical protein